MEQIEVLYERLIDATSRLCGRDRIAEISIVQREIEDSMEFQPPTEPDTEEALAA